MESLNLVLYGVEYKNHYSDPLLFMLYTLTY